MYNTRAARFLIAILIVVSAFESGGFGLVASREDVLRYLSGIQGHAVSDVLNRDIIGAISPFNNQHINGGKGSALDVLIQEIAKSLTPTPTIARTATLTATNTNTSTPTDTGTATLTATNANTSTPTDTGTPTITPTPVTVRSASVPDILEIFRSLPLPYM